MMPGSVRVLFVNPNESDRSCFSAFFVGKRIRVIAAEDCAAALSRMRCQRVDAVIARSQEAKAILTALQQEPNLADLPVIGLLENAAEVPDPRFCAARQASCRPSELFFALLGVLDCHAARVSMPRRDASGVCAGATEPHT
ncbi:MAG: hypothetical protein EHM13_01500 [Acidobacteria bacterium]|nr:MAG: hypothetical protein EHM13_01500 [Acidobacteriota bacterium]